ncbi:polysaccharide deacetylase [Paenibacillus sp. YPG26]|uniref:polysaccharide deacetylase n=1 Tax=Paenibacillus sp. YPG26 TaxID=2878915 RepID=UPI00203ED4FE|nr:polysaccharide deacetylase [Paenibacillus sp. YPG26]USB33853.1 polysaccharide deacetylase [Paenibacillus sp. YPG26]
MYRTFLHVLKRLYVPAILALLIIGALPLDLQSPMKSTVYAQEGFQPISAMSQISARPIAGRTSESPVTTASHTTNKRIVYLTFDDGPTKLTDQVLQILSRNKIKGTFFVLGEQAQRFPEIIRRIADGGHALGNHTFDHEYKKLYHNFSEFWGQIKQTEEILRNITGSRPDLVRAPGGTFGHFDHNYFKLLEQGGYTVFDWDVDTRDSSRKGVPAAELIRNVKRAKLKDQLVVLMHDGAGHEETVKALPVIISYYKAHGYEFGILSSKVKPVHFSVHVSAVYKGRAQPTAKWIAANVVPNAALFKRAPSLIVQAGGVETEMKSGEFELSSGRYMVPLRAVLERLGATVLWNQAQQSAQVNWGTRVLTVRVEAGRVELRRKGGQTSTAYQIPLSTRNDAIWVPLRSLLEMLGHPITHTAGGPDNYKVIAL